jgi:hypothetical protein
MNQLGGIFMLENRLRQNPLRDWQLFGKWLYFPGIDVMLIARRML